MRRWNTSTIATSGSITITDAALIGPTGISSVFSPWKKLIAAGIVMLLSVADSVTAMRNSFHVLMKTRIALVNTPGAASGRAGSYFLRNKWF